MKYLTMIVISLLILSGCSSGGAQPGTEKIDNTGKGLEVSFKIDDKFIPTLQYEIELKNSGLEPVILKKDNFYFTTTQRTQDLRPVFTQSSLDEFKQNIFQNKDEIVLYQNKEIVKSGSLEIDPSFYSNLNEMEINYILKAEYEYKTEFNNNLEIDFGNLKIKTDSISQAAPIEITEIDLFTKNSQDMKVTYTIKDTNSGTLSDNERIEIDSYEINLGANQVSCVPYYEENGGFKKIDDYIFAISKEQPEVVLVCDFDTYNYGDSSKITTKTYGVLEYTYSIKEEDMIRLPSERSSQFE